MQGPNSGPIGDNHSSPITPNWVAKIAAVRSALNSVGQVILEDHLASCMVKAVPDGNFEGAYKDLKIFLDRFIG